MPINAPRSGRISNNSICFLTILLALTVFVEIRQRQEVWESMQELILSQAHDVTLHGLPASTIGAALQRLYLFIFSKQKELQVLPFWKQNCSVWLADAGYTNLWKYESSPLSFICQQKWRKITQRDWKLFCIANVIYFTYYSMKKMRSYWLSYSSFLFPSIKQKETPPNNAKVSAC